MRWVLLLLGVALDGACADGDWGEVLFDLRHDGSGAAYRRSLEGREECECEKFEGDQHLRLHVSYQSPPFACKTI